MGKGASWATVRGVTESRSINFRYVTTDIHTRLKRSSLFSPTVTHYHMSPSSFLLFVYDLTVRKLTLTHLLNFPVYIKSSFRTITSTTVGNKFFN